MAGLPPDGRLLVQQADGIVRVFDRNTEEVFHEWDPHSANASCLAMAKVFQDERLTLEQQCFTAFWAGYFHAHAR